MSNLNLYFAFFQNPESGVIVTSKTVRSFGLGKSILATLPPSSSAISVKDEKKKKEYIYHQYTFMVR
jgi:hypothetical protein